MLLMRNTKTAFRLQTKAKLHRCYGSLMKLLTNFMCHTLPKVLTRQLEHISMVISAWIRFFLPTWVVWYLSDARGKQQCHLSYNLTNRVSSTPSFYSHLLLFEIYIYARWFMNCGLSYPLSPGYASNWWIMMETQWVYLKPIAKCKQRKL